MSRSKIYAGIDKDKGSSMNPTGNIIRDAWVFGILPEDETCEGWDQSQMNVLYDQVSEAWMPYGHLASRLPENLQQKHELIYAAAIDRARLSGWNPNAELEDED